MVSRFDFTGAHNFYYSEEYYFGNPGYYQSWIFALSGSGFLGLNYENSENFVVPPGRRNIENVDIKEEDIKIFRSKAIINTYTITSPLLNFDYNSYPNDRLRLIGSQIYADCQIL